MRLSAIALAMATVVAACGSNSAGAPVPPQPDGSSCTTRDECTSHACVDLVCGPGVALDGACNSDDECPDGSCVAGGSGKVCALACTRQGTTGCNHAASAAWVCDGAQFHPFGSCQTCYAGSGVVPQTFVTCGDDQLKLADPGATCTDTNDGACTLDHTELLSCEGGAWKVVDTCRGTTPYCGHLAAGTGSCPTTAKNGCAGCGQ